jgi:metal-responsive CopG/Arc/MetJ family transcriptional regulator
MRTVQAPDKRKIGVHVSLDLAILGRLDAIASERGVSRSELLRELIDELVEREDEARWLAERAEAELQEERVPWEQAKAELGL